MSKIFFVILSQEYFLIPIRIPINTDFYRSQWKDLNKQPVVNQQVVTYNNKNNITLCYVKI